MRKLIPILVLLSTVLQAQVTIKPRYVHLENLYFRNSAGIDTARMRIDTSNGNLLFEYKKPSYPDSALWRDTTSNFYMFDEGCGNASRWGNISFSSSITCPSDSSLHLAARFEKAILAMSPKVASTVWSAFDATFWVDTSGGVTPSSDSTMWQNIGHYAYSNTSYSQYNFGDQAPIEFDFTYLPYEDLPHGYANYEPTFWVFGFSGNETMHFKVSLIFYANKPYGPYCETANINFIPPHMEDFTVWARGYQYTVPASWVTGGYWDRADLYVIGNFFLSNLLASTVQAYQSVSAGNLSDSTAGSLQLLSPYGIWSGFFSEDTGSSAYKTPGRSGTLSLEQVVRGAGLISVTQNQDTTDISWTGADSGSVRSYITQPADKVPGTANSLNDEFNTTTPPDTTTKWAWRNRGTKTTLANYNTVCVMADTGAAASDQLRIIEQSTTDTTFTITARISHSLRKVNYVDGGICVVNSSSGKIVYFGPFAQVTNSAVGIQVYKYTNVTTQSSVPYTQYSAGSPYGFYRLEKTIGDSLWAWYSSDGIAWSKVWGEACSTFIEDSGVIDKVGLLVKTYGSGSEAVLSFWWFRYNWTADFHPTLDN